MTPREIKAASKGYGTRAREQVVMHPLSDFDSKRKAEAFIRGERRSTPAPEEQERKLEQLKSRFSG